MAEITASLVQELREKTGLGMMQCKKALTESGGDMEKAVEHLRKQGAAVAAKRSSKEAKEGRVLLGTSGNITAAVEVNCETDFVSSGDDFKSFSSKVLQAALDNKCNTVDELKAIKLGSQTLGEINLEMVGKIGENIGIRRVVVETANAGEHVETYSHLGGKIGVIVKLTFTGTPSDTNVLSTVAKDVAMQVAAMPPVAVRPEEIDPELIAKEREIYRETTLKEGKQGPVVDKIVDGKVQKFFKENCLLQQIFVKDSKQTVEKYLESSGKNVGVEGLTVKSYHRMQLGA